MTSSHKKNLVASGIGILGVELANHWFDIILYGLAIGYFGMLWGGGLMTLLSLPLNWMNIRIYRKLGASQLFEWMDAQVDGETPTAIGRVLRFFESLGYWPTVIFLCWEDPSKAFVFVRRGVNPSFNAMDWRVFLWTNFVGNLIHTISIGGLIAFIRALV